MDTKKSDKLKQQKESGNMPSPRAGSKDRVQQVPDIGAGNLSDLWQLFDLLGDFVFIVDLEQRIIEVNQVVLDCLGYTREELVGSHFTKVHPPERKSEAIETMSALLNGELRSCLIPLQNKYGALVPVETRVTTSRWNEQDVLVGVSRDITSYRHMEEVLQDREARLKTIFRTAPVGMGLLVNRVFLQVNDWMCRMTGYSETELIGQSARMVYPSEEEFQYVGREKYRQIDSYGIGHVETRWARKNGQVIDVYLSSAVIDPDDPSSGTIFTALDITGRKQAENLLRIQRDLGMVLVSTSDTEEALVRFLNVVTQIDDVDCGGVYLANPETGELDLLVSMGLSDWFVELVSHYPPDSFQSRLAMKGQPVYVHYPRVPQLSDEVKSREGLRALAIIPIRYEERIVAVLSLASRTVDEFESDTRDLLETITNQIDGVIARMRAETALRESEERFRTIFEGSSVGIITTDMKGYAIQANRAFQDMMGYSEADLRTMTPKSYSHPDDRDADKAHFREMLDTGRDHYQIEKRYIRKDGQVISTILSVFLIRDTAGNPQFLVAMLQDITDLRKLEDQLRQSQKMESLGTLAGGIAHDFNNLLTTIGGYSELLSMSFDPGSEEYEYINYIEQAAGRATALTRQLLAFSRRQVLEPTSMSLNQIINDTQSMFQRLIGEDVELITQLDPETANIKADAGQMQQVIMNLIINAREAMPKGGRITIETRNVFLDEHYVSQQSGVEPGHFVMMSIHDTGMGMDNRTMSRIFEPFFTTKEKGTGLGLSTVYGIVKQSDGHISVDSEPERGTAFKVYLPIVAESEFQDSPAVHSADSLTGTETILLVEDDDTVRAFTRAALVKYGYQVEEAWNGQEALALCEKLNGPIHLLLTDVVMPGGVSGREVADHLKTTQPQAKILYMSGYTDSALSNHGILEPGIALLQKPFTPIGLLLKVRQILDG